jgi:hypothetical protein
MSHLFKDLPVGYKFRTEKSNGIGATKNIISWMEYVKISKSKAECINQVNYGNTRAVGHVNPFAPYKTVYDI